MASRVHLTADLPGVGGVLKATPEDFIVEEIPAYAPSGEGDHVFLTVEKRGITTHEMVRRIARALGVPSTSVGTAGQKDRQAIARQVISVPAQEPDAAARISALSLEGIQILSAARHRHKLRTGHLKGNRFSVTVRGVVDGAEPLARAILDRLVAIWLPNFFGDQRFGRSGDNAATGRGLIVGERRERDPVKRRFLISAYQAELFNRYLAERLGNGTIVRVIDGEVLQRVASGGLFHAISTENAGNQARLEARQIVPTGPMFGHRMFSPMPDSVAAAIEDRLLESERLTPSSFASVGKLAEGTRRALLARISDARLVVEGDRMDCTFTLPPGTYATVLLDELMKVPAAPAAAIAPPAAEAAAVADPADPSDPASEPVDPLE